MPHTPNHRDERRQIADNLDQKLGLGYRIGQGLRRGANAAGNYVSKLPTTPIIGNVIQTPRAAYERYQQAGGGARGVGAATGGYVRDIGSTAMEAGRATTPSDGGTTKRLAGGFAAGFSGQPLAPAPAAPRAATPPPDAVDEPFAAEPAPPTGVRRQDLYTVQPGTDPSRVEFADTGEGVGTFEGANARQRLADGTGSLTIMPAADVSRALRAPSPETAAALSAARAAAADRGDFEAVRLSNMTPEQRTQWQAEKQAARARDDRAQLIRGLRRDAAGSGRAGYESAGAQFADAQKRRAAREQLKLIADQDAAAASAQADIQAAQLGAEGRLAAAETNAAGRVEAAGVRRQTGQTQAEAASQRDSTNRAFDTLQLRYTDPETGKVKDPDGLAIARAQLEAQLSGDPETPYRLDTPSGIETRMSVKKKLLKATNENRDDSFFKKLNEWIHNRDTSLDTWINDSSLEGIRVDGDRVYFDPPAGSPEGTVGADIPIEELYSRLGSETATAILNINKMDNQQVRR